MTINISPRALMGAALALVLLVGGWWGASPYWTMYQIKGAIEAQDADKLSSYIDFPKIQQSFKSELQRTMQAAMAEQAKTNPNSPEAAMGGAIAQAMMGPMIDGLVSRMMTPAGLKALMEKQKERNAAPGNGSAAPAKDGQTPDYDIDRQGLSNFDLVLHDKSTKNIRIHFERDGLSWNLVGFTLPDDLSSIFSKR